MKKIFIVIILCFFLPLLASAGTVTAKFGGKPTAGCLPLDVNFTDSSTVTSGTIVRHKWIFDLVHAADTSNSVNPVWTFADTGNHVVKLIVWSSTGSKDSTTRVVRVNGQPVIRFSTPDTLGFCAPHTVTFSNNSDTSCTSYYTWYIDTAIIHSVHNTSVNYTFKKPGFYTIILVDSTGCGCSGNLTKLNYIKVDTPATACITTNDTFGCAPPFTVHFNNCSSGANSYFWKFGDGGTDTAKNPVYTYTSINVAGFTDSLYAITPAGCTTKISKPNYIKVSHFYPGLKYIYPTTLAPVTGGISCIGKVIDVVDTTYGANHFHIQFSNTPGDTSSVANTFHAWANKGIYTVKDSAWNNFGCHGVVSQNIYIDTFPSIDSIKTTHFYRCTTADTVLFHSFVTDTASIASLLWQFGDTPGPFDTAVSDTTHIYAPPAYANFSPILTVTDIHGCSSTRTFTNFIQIQPPYHAIIVSIDSGCHGFTTYFHDTISPGVLFYVDSIQYNDGKPTDTGLAIRSGTYSHTYDSVGRFMMYHYYHLDSSFGGCSYVDSIRVSAGDTPILANMFHTLPHADSVCPQINQRFNDSCFNCTSVTWNVGGNVFHQMDTTFPFGASGLRAVLYVANYNGCTDTLRDSIYVWPPNVNFTVSDVCVHRDSFLFSVTSSPAVVPPAYHWGFGDGSLASSTASSIYHYYTSDGVDTVIFSDTAKSPNHGCFNFYKQEVYVYPVKALTTNFTVSKALTCKNTPITFYGPLTQYDSTYKTYKWDFGDGSIAFINAGPNPNQTSYDTIVHSYTATGVYTVKLTVTNRYGCTDSITRSNLIRITAPTGGLYVNGALTSSATTVTGCAPYTPFFQDTNTAYTGYNIAKRRWLFNAAPTVSGTGVPSTSYINGFGRDTSITFPKGLYHVVVSDTDNLGCFVNDTVLINAVKPVAYFSSSDTIACTNVKIHFVDTTTHASYHWRFGDGTPAVVSVATDTNHIYYANGTYNITLITISDGTGYMPAGCVDSQVRPTYVQIGNASVHANFNLTSTFAVCPNLTVSTINSSTSLYGSYYKWKFGLDSTTIYSNNTNLSYIYTYPGVYNVTLIDSNTLGCQDSFKKQVTILGPTGTLTATPDTICASQTILFHISSPTLTAGVDTVFTWYSGIVSGLHTDTAGYPQRYDSINAGSYKPHVTIKHNNCSVNVYVKDSVIVHPLPVITMPADTICKYTSVTMSATGASTYSWSPPTGLSCTSCATVLANPLLTTNYRIIGTSSFGCIDSTHGKLVVDVPNIVTITGSGNNSGILDSICLGNCDTLFGSGISGPFTWFPNTSLTWSPASDTAVFCPGAAATDTVFFAGYDARGCRDTGYKAIRVHGPTGVLSIINDSICKEQTASLIHVSNTGAFPLDAVYIWHLPTYNDTTTDTPGILMYYDTVGTWSPSVTIRNHGCSETMSTTAKIYVFGKNNVTVNSATICPFTSASLSATGAPHYTWLPAANLSCTSCNSVVATPPSTTVFSVIGTNVHGCTDTAAATVTVEIPPAITVTGKNFSTSVDSVCFGDKDTLTGSASGIGGPYKWTPATGLSCTTCFQTVFTPTASGTYVFTFVATYGTGCKDTVFKTVYVHGPTGTLSMSSDSLCKLQTSSLLHLTNTSADPLDAVYIWHFPTYNDTTTDTPGILMFYDTAGTWNPSVTIRNNGCSETVHTSSFLHVFSKTVFSGPGATICPQSSVTLHMSGSLPSYSWSPTSSLSCGSCATSTAHPSATTVYTIVGTNFHGCKDTAFTTVVVEVPPTMNITGSTGSSGIDTICFGAKDTLEGIATGISAPYLWYPSANLSCVLCNQTVFTPTISGTYNYNFVATYGVGCKDTVAKTVYVHGPTGTLSISSDSLCKLQTSSLIHLNNTSADPLDAVYIWHFPTYNDTTTDTPGILMYYDTAGTWNPSVTIRNNGCSEVVHTSSNLYVFNKTNITCSNATICPFTSTTLTASGVVPHHTWMPAGSLSCTTCGTTFASPSATTIYTVIGTNFHGCKDTVHVTVTVDIPPAITVTGHNNSIGTDSICFGKPDTLTASAVGITTPYRWLPIGNLSCTTCSQTVFTPTASGTYNHYFIAQYGVSCSDTVQKTVYVHGPTGVMTLSADTLCKLHTSELIHLTNTSTDPLDAVYIWHLPPHADTVTDTPGIRLMYDTAGVWNPSVTIRNFGCSETMYSTSAISVFTKPNLQTNGAIICPQGTAALHATGAISYKWKPATVLSCDNCATTYASPATTTVFTLIGTGTGSCNDTVTATVVIDHPVPVTVTGTGGHIGLDSVCKSSYDTLTVTGFKIQRPYKWFPATNLSCDTCGQTLFSSAVSATFVYTITATDSLGCADTAYKSAWVHCPTGILSVSNDSLCARETSTSLHINNTGTLPLNPNYAWHLPPYADIVTDTPGLIFRYDTFGVWNPSVTVSSVGCSQNIRATDSIYVFPKPKVTANSDTICKYRSAALSATGAFSYSWTPAASLSCTNCASPIAAPAANTVYTIIGTSVHGCVDTTTARVYITPVPVISVSGTGNHFGIDSLCFGSSDTLHIVGTGCKRPFVWYPASGLNCDTCNSAIFTPDSSIRYNKTIVATYGNGCADTAYKSIYVHGPTGTISVSKDSVCMNQNTTHLHVNNTGPGILDPHFVWNLPPLGTFITDTGGITVLYNVAGTWSISAVIRDSGCYATVIAPNSVNVFDKTHLTVNNTAICKYGTATLVASPAVAAYSWTPAGNLTCSTCDTTIARPAVTTIYTLTSANQFGCRDTTTAMVYVDVPPAVTIAGTGNHFGLDSICFGTSDTLRAVGHLLQRPFSWLPRTLLTTPDSGVTLFTGDTTKTYSFTVIATDSLGCPDTATTKMIWVHRPTAVLAVNGSATAVDSVCPGTTVALHIQNTGALPLDPHYRWSVPPFIYTITDTPGVHFNYIDTGFWRPSVVVSSAGCSVTITTNAAVRVAPLPALTVTHPLLVCTGDSAVLQVTGAATYAWSPTTGLSCTSCATTVAKPIVTTSYTVTGSSALSCTDTIQTTVFADVLPLLKVTGRDTICAGDRDTLSLIGGKNLSWTPNISLSCVLCDTVVAQPIVSRQYFVAGVDSGNCPVKDSFRIQVNAVPTFGSSIATSVICDSSLFTYNVIYTPATTAVTWQRPRNSNVVPPAQSGADSISELLQVTNHVYDTVIYNYTLNNYGCMDSAKFSVVIMPKPTVPYINLVATRTVCNNTLYQTYGAAVPQPAGYTYRWTADNAVIWATSADKQNCVVNFPNTGMAVIKLTSSISGTDCSSYDTVGVNVTPQNTSQYGVTYDRNTFVCLNNTVDRYQWGYDDKLTLDSTVLAGEVYQNYYNPNPDLANKYFWVMTQKDGCYQKSYYNAPSGITGTAVTSAEMKVFPNPASGLIEVQLFGVRLSNRSKLVIRDVSGKQNLVLNAADKMTVDISNLAQGFYFVSYYDNDVFIASAKFVKE
jgi:PKD repeat protein